MSAVGGAEPAAVSRVEPAPAVRARAIPGWWPLAALTLLGAALRLATLDLQGLWYDEAFTPVHVLHPGLSATLHAVVHTENTPPLWYLLEWADARVFGTGAIALRLPSALAGIATIPVAWAIGRAAVDSKGERAAGPPRAAGAAAGPAPAPARRLAPGNRVAIACAALVAVNPLFVWYSQEARAYGLFVLMAALAVLSFLRLRNAPSARRAAEFALAGSLLMLTHYFGVFLLAPMAAILLVERGAARRAALPALAVQGAVGLALIPLIWTQGGHGTQWIGRWPLSDRLQAIGQYFLLGPSGEPLGHGVELLVALPVLGCVFAGLWSLVGRTDAAARAELLGARTLALVAAGGVLIPLALAVAGSDYLAPRNLVGAMIPLTAMIAVLAATPAAGRVGLALLVASVLGFLAITLDVDFSPRLQRGDWRGVARTLRAAEARRAITTIELGAAPLEYYLPGLRNLARSSTVALTEIDATGYAPLKPGADRPPAPGFRLVARANIHGLVVYRFVAPAPVAVNEARLRGSVITRAHPEVLVPGALRAGAAGRNY